MHVRISGGPGWATTQVYPVTGSIVSGMTAAMGSSLMARFRSSPHAALW